MARQNTELSVKHESCKTELITLLDISVSLELNGTDESTNMKKHLRPVTSEVGIRKRKKDCVTKHGFLCKLYMTNLRDGYKQKERVYAFRMKKDFYTQIKKIEKYWNDETKLLKVNTCYKTLNGSAAVKNETYFVLIFK